MEEQESPIAKCTFDPEKEGPCKEKDCPHFPGIDWEKCRWGELPPEDRPIVEHSYSWYIIYREPQDITEVQ